MDGKNMVLPGAVAEVIETDGLWMAIEFKTPEDRETFEQYMKGYKTFVALKKRGMKPMCT